MFGGVHVRRCSSAVNGGGPLCSAVLRVRLCSAVSSSFRCILPGLFTSLLSESRPRKLGRPAGGGPGVNDTWYNMRRRIGTFISCVHLSCVHL